MESHDVTSAGVSPAEDRARRMKVYTIMMAIRMACVASLLFVRGWWILVAALGAVFLPYIAVLFANEPDHTAKAQPQPLAPLALTPGEADTAASPEIIVIDAPAERRSTAESEQSGHAERPEHDEQQDRA